MIRNLFLMGGIVLAVAIAVVFGSATTAFVGSGEAISKTISDVGTRVFKTKVSVAEATLSVKTAHTQLIGLRVHNPPGFSNDAALHFPLIAADVRARPEIDGTIHVREALIERPNVVLEIVAGNANLPRLRDSAKAALKDTGITEDGRKFVIDTLLMRGGMLILRADFLESHEISAAMPEMQLENLGQRSDGLNNKEIMSEIVTMMVIAAERAVRRVDLADAAKKMDLPTPDVDLSSIVLDQGENSQ